MNIAVFIKRTHFHQNSGGLATQNKSLCEGLVKRGHQVTVFSPLWELDSGEESENGVNYVFVDSEYRMGKFLGFGGTKDPDNWVNKSYETFLFKNKPKFDLVLSQSSAGLGIIYRKEKLGIPVVSVSHGSIIGEYSTYIGGIDWKDPKNWIKIIKNTGFTLKNFFGRQREFVHGSDKVITVSNYVRKALIEETFAPDEKFAVINNGIDPTPILETQKQTQVQEEICKAKFLYVTRVEKEKGPDTFVEILQDPRFNDVCVEVAGEGPYFQELGKIIKEKKLSKRYILRGKINYSEVPQFYKSSDVAIFCMPTKRVEGFPMVLVEAMFAGLPIVAYNMGGVSDAIDEENTGFVVPSGDIEVLKQRLLELIKDPELRQKMGERAIVRAKKHFTLDVMIDQYLSVFDKVLEKYENS